MERTKIFISYSHEDNVWREHLVKQLRVLACEGLLDVWDDLMIGAGEDWSKHLHQQMLQARIAVLLLSANFLASDFIRREEIKTLFEQHEARGMAIYPLLVRDCPWQVV